MTHEEMQSRYAPPRIEDTATARRVVHLAQCAYRFSQSLNAFLPEGPLRDISLANVYASYIAASGALNASCKQPNPGRLPGRPIKTPIP
jgi:hypothetical protein